jgi:hypothetical protein
MAYLSTFDVPMTMGFFLIVTGALTWLFIAITGFWFIIDALEKLIGRLTRREADLTVRIYPHR